MTTRKGLTRIFSEVSSTYELVNHVLTLGLDIIWRKSAARRAAGHGGSLWLDACSGTGETARGLSRLAGPKTRVVALDFTPSMLFLSRNRSRPEKIMFVLGDVRSLPFPDASFDLAVVSFATRNLNPHRKWLDIHLREFHRILKPSGIFLNLETSQPPNPVLRGLFHFYVNLLVKPVGYLISGSSAGYAYLSKTIPRFYGAPAFKAVLEEAGFARVSYRRFFFGVAAIHTAYK